MKESVNIYTSLCCQVAATKPACVKPHAQTKPKGKKGKGRGEQKAPELATLGSWRCGQCGKPCKVTVSARPPKEEVINA